MKQRAYASLPKADQRFDGRQSFPLRLGIRVFYRGLLPSLIGITHPAVQFPLHEWLKRWAREYPLPCQLIRPRFAFIHQRKIRMFRCQTILLSFVLQYQKSPPLLLHTLMK